MIVRMLMDKTGPRYDDRLWPAAGEQIEVPDDEGKALIAHGQAEAVKQPKQPKSNGTPLAGPPADPPASPTAPPSLKDLLD